MILRNQFFAVIILSSCAYNTFGQSHFVDISSSSNFANTGANYGVAVADYDNDGDDDVYISRYFDTNLLYRNNGNGTFTDVAAQAGVDFDGNTRNSVWGDLNNDGDLDLYLGNFQSSNILYLNNGDGTFEDVSMEAGVDNAGNPRSVLMADVDRDGWLDIYVANLLQENILYKNNGQANLSFYDATQESGLTDTQISMGSVFFDYDNDGDSDLYLTHDGNQANILYQNNGNGIFTDVSEASGADYEGQGMGVDFGDIDGDGWLDLYITNLNKNTLLHNNGDGTFTNIAESAGVTDIGMGWGTTFLDFNNDGWQDIYMVNDSYFAPYPNILYQNNGDNTFTAFPEEAPINSMYGSYGTACTDINKDGRLEVLVSNNGTDGNQLFENISPEAGNWLKVKAIGTISNRSAIGTKVTLESEGKIFTDEIAGGSGYASQNSFTLHFGLGNIQMIEKMTINWTNGLIETYENLEVNKVFEVVENESLSTGNGFQVENEIQIKTYPNPVKDILNLSIKNLKSQEIEIELWNSIGVKVRTLYKTSLSTDYFDLTWNLSEFLHSKGLYFIKIKTEDGEQIQKIIFAP